MPVTLPSAYGGLSRGLSQGFGMMNLIDRTKMQKEEMARQNQYRNEMLKLKQQENSFQQQHTQWLEIYTELNDKINRGMKIVNPNQRAEYFNQLSTLYPENKYPKMNATIKALSVAQKDVADRFNRGMKETGALLQKRDLKGQELLLKGAEYADTPLGPLLTAIGKARMKSEYDLKKTKIIVQGGIDEALIKQKNATMKDNMAVLGKAQGAVTTELNQIYKRNGIGSVDIVALMAKTPEERREYLLSKGQTAMEKLKGGEKVRAIQLNERLSYITDQMSGINPSLTQKTGVIPSDSDVNYYLDKANGDPSKARAMAKRDGFMVNDIPQSKTFPGVIRRTEGRIKYYEVPKWQR